MTPTVDPMFWKGRRVLLTGHTGFKGSWLSLWLQALGAQVRGIALAPPTDPALFEVAGVAAGMDHCLADIRDYSAIWPLIHDFRPQIVLHLAAQPLVRHSYAEPVATFATNVMGTVHVLEAARHVGTVEAVVNVTTDKCYENRGWVWGYREDEPMGGQDPYSGSKGCAELVTSSYRQSFMNSAGIALASGRAGNVIGGGDWAADRLVPDILRAFERREPVRIRNPQATRPWQHVLEPLSAYLLLAQRLLEDRRAWSEGWNFGPRDEDAKPVGWIVERMVGLWGQDAAWVIDDGSHPHEAHYLKLDISKAGSRLGWRPRWNLGTALEKIITWHQAWRASEDVHKVCLEQIAEYSNAP